MSFIRRLFRKRLKASIPRFPLVACCDCGNPVYNGETGYLVQTTPIGFTDDETVTKLVCQYCYVTRYGRCFLRSKYVYAYSEDE